MVKAAVDVSSTVQAYIEKLKRKLPLERVILSDVHTEGIDGEASEIVFIVVSPAFEGLEPPEKSRKLGLLGYEVSSLVTAFPYTPDEFDGFFRGDSYSGVLSQLLNGSREIYRKHGTPLHKLLQTAGGKR